MKNRKITIRDFALFLLSILLGFSSSCTKDVDEASFYDADKVTILNYLHQSPEYSQFVELAEMGGYSGLLGAYGTYTVFVFDNNALEAYKKQHNIASFDKESAKRLIEYHILKGIVTSETMGNGGMKTPTIANDFIVADLVEDNKIILNNHSLIQSRDIVLTNGYIQIIDKVMPPIDEDIKSRILEEDGFSIFKALWQKSDFENIYDAQKNPVTFFIVPDSVYKKAGLNSVEDVMNLPNIINDKQKLNDFIAYHAITGFHFLNFFEGGNYATLGKDMLSFKIENRYKVNKRFITTPGGEDKEMYIPVHPSMSNRQAKNGVFHVLGDVLIPITPPAEYSFFDFCEQEELMSLPEYKSKGISGIQGWDFKRLKVQVSGGQFNYFVSSYWQDRKYYNNADILNFTGGRWSLELISPKIGAGKYRMRLLYKKGSARGAVQVYLDGKKVGDPVNMRNSISTDKDIVNARNYWHAFVKDVYFDQTKEHVIRLQTVIPGQGLLDGMEFEPINE